MKNSRNRYRSESSNVRSLERRLSLRERLFSLLAIKRGTQRVKHILKMCLIALPLVFLAWYGINYALDMAYGMSVEYIHFQSRHGIVNKEQALQLLGIEGRVNMATLNTESLRRKLEAVPGIRSAIIRAELPDTLYIEVEERIPIVFVEWEDGVRTGDRSRFFMDPEGVLFRPHDELHGQFMGVATWYLRPEDAAKLSEGEKIEEQLSRPIARLVAASNNYNPDEIPRIVEIFHPKDWEFRLILETGTEVMMEKRNIHEQMDRLAMIFDHARATHRKLRSVNVIPALNPVAVFEEEKEQEPKK